MARARLNASRGLARLDGMRTELRLGAERINRREARVLQRAMKRVSPVDTRPSKDNVVMKQQIKIRKARKVHSPRRAQARAAVFLAARAVGAAVGGVAGGIAAGAAVKHATRQRTTWQVYIPRRPFPRFWYPRLYLSAMYKKISPLRTPVKSRMRTFLSGVFRRA